MSDRKTARSGQNSLQSARAVGTKAFFLGFGAGRRHVEHGFVLSKQVLRSGTSIGANVEEAAAAISKADFSSKISNAYKEAKETSYWLRLLYDTDYIDKKSFDSIFSDVEELCKLLFTILKSSGRVKTMSNE